MKSRSGKTEDNAAALDEDKDQDQAKVEKELRQKVKNSLSKILTSNVLPPIPEEDSIMSIEDFGLLDRPYLSVSSPADTEDTGETSSWHGHRESWRIQAFYAMEEWKEQL